MALSGRPYWMATGNPYFVRFIRRMSSSSVSRLGWQLALATVGWVCNAGVLGLHRRGDIHTLPNSCPLTYVLCIADYLSSKA